VRLVAGAWATASGALLARGTRFTICFHHSEATGPPTEVLHNASQTLQTIEAPPECECQHVWIGRSAVRNEQ
jgi:hypothetical protein